MGNSGFLILFECSGSLLSSDVVKIKYTHKLALLDLELDLGLWILDGK